MKALGVAVLPRGTRFDIQRFDPKFSQPSPKCIGDELRTVVTANVTRHSSHRDQLGQRIDHVLAGDASSHLEDETFAGVFIDDRQLLQLTS